MTFMMDGTFGMMTGMGLIGLIYFALGSFIFSAIFWLTYNWLVKIEEINNNLRNSEISYIKTNKHYITQTFI